MRKTLAFLTAGIAVGVALARLFRRRRRVEAPVPAADDADPRAQALRDQLAETREGGPGDAAPAEPEASDVDAERRRVHERGRAAVDAMKKAGGAP